MGLPNGYTEVQYIESTGTQWINTGFKPNQNTRVKMDCNVIGFNSSDAFLFGARIASGNTAFCLAADDENTRWFALYGNNVQNPTGTCKGKHSIDFNQNVLTLDEKNFTFEKTTFQSSYNLLLFATITNGNVDSQRGKMAVYSCQIYDNGNLIRDFIPCIDPTGAVGLYDLVGRKFYRNAGTGVFLAGPPKVTLPKGYKQLEYIQSSGTQYVDTNVKPTQAFLLDISIQTLQTTSGGIAASDQTWGTNGFGVWCNAAAFGSQTKPSLSLYNDAPIVIKLSQSGLFLNGSSIWTVNSETFTVPANMYLFALNRNGVISEKLTGKLYSCKLYDNATLIRDFIPCKNDAGAIGLYDLVNSKFYGNAGTGAFIAGPEVIWPSNDAIYVKVNGIWKQIDGITIS